MNPVSTDNSTIAVLIKTVLRQGCVEKLIESIDRYIGVPYRLYIADEHPVSESRSKLYKHLADQGHFIHIYEQATPVYVTVARNFLVDSLAQEKFVLRVDDDFVLTELTDIRLMASILEERPEIGAISDLEVQVRADKGVKAGTISDAQGYFVMVNSSLLKIKVSSDSWQWFKLPSGARFAYADFTRNMLLIRRSVFNRVRWNDNLKINGEHTDFMLSLKRAGWVLAFTPDSTHLHDDPPPMKTTSAYRKIRESNLGLSLMNEIFQSRWSVSKVITRSVSHVSLLEKIKLSLKTKLKIYLRRWL